MTAQQQKQGKFAATIVCFMAHALNTFFCRVALGALGTTALHTAAEPAVRAAVKNLTVLRKRRNNSLFIRSQQK